MSKVDLHVHSTASDGRFSPEEVVNKAAALGLTFMALTDHDTIDGIIPALLAARAFPQLRVIPGVEISTDTPNGEVHVLGYFVDYTDEELKAALERFRDSRQRRAQGIIAKLGDLGIHIDWQRVREIAGAGSIGRPHIAQAMLEKAYISSLQEAFAKYIAQGGPAYVEREKMTPVEAVELIVQSDGLPVMAHPFTVTDPEAVTIGLKTAGLAGIEAYYGDYSDDEIKILVDLASRHKLIVSGGSDYHGLDEDKETMIGGAGVPLESGEHLIALAEQRELKTINPLIL
ncbi:PHP domain-containing protein [Chloroflexota bacterium]